MQLERQLAVVGIGVASRVVFGQTGGVGSLLVVTGPPGAGKSTVSVELANRTSPSVLVRGDDFYGFLAAGAIEPWLPGSGTQNEIVTEAAARAAGRFAEDYDTVYDGVVWPWFLPTFASVSGLATFDYSEILPSGFLPPAMKPPGTWHHADWPGTG